MLDWIRRIRKVSQTLSLPSRDASSGRSQNQLNPAKLFPATEQYLSRLIQQDLLVADLLSDDAAKAPNTEMAKEQKRIAKRYQQRAGEHRELLIKLGSTFMELQQDCRDHLDEMIARTEGEGWHEDLMRIYIVFGILEDAQLRLAKGLTPARRVKVEAGLSDNSLMDFCEQSLSREIADNPGLASDLALFGRAVVADALLAVRDMLSFDQVISRPAKDPVELKREQFRAIEPLTSELISAHTLRMDALGLTA
jgi:hypothetical protein